MLSSKGILLTAFFSLILLSAFAQVLVESYEPRLRGFPTTIRVGETSDGGILVCGYIDFLNGSHAGRLIKLNENGESFLGFQKVTGDGWIMKATGLSNGKILVLGDFTQLNGTITSNLSRLNSDGSLDQTFSSAIMVYDFALQSDGEIIVLTSTGMKRLNSNGSVDASFNVLAGNFRYDQVNVSADDFIYLSINNTLIKRYNSNGTIDAGFAPVTSDGTMTDLQPTTNGIIVAGSFTQVSGVSANNVALIKSNGSPDLTFNIGAGPGYGTIYSVALRANGNILIAGNIDSFDNVAGSAFELSPLGELLQAIGKVHYWNVENIKETSSQKILIAGQFTYANGADRNGLALYNKDYSINLNFKPDVTYSLGPYWELLPPPTISSKHEVFFAGSGVSTLGFLGAYQNNEPFNTQFLKLDSLGTPDNEYMVPGFYSPGWIRSLAIQPEGKVLLGGAFTIDGVQHILARLKSNGAIDDSFEFHWGQNDFVNKIIIKGSLIYVAGKFTTDDNPPANSLVAVDFNGSVIKKYSGISTDMEISTLNIQDDNKVIITAKFDSPTGTTYNIIRLNEDGSIDNSFQQGVFNEKLHDIEIDKNGNLYCAGSFTLFNGAAKSSLIRLNKNGTLDNTFVTGGSFGNGVALTLQLLPNENLLVGGVFSSYRGSPCYGFAQIDAAGTLVQSPVFTFGKQSQVMSIDLIGNHLFVTGRILSANYQSVISIAKFNLGSVAVSLPQPPTNLIGTLVERGVHLNWNDNSNNEAGFVIERGDLNGEFASVSTVAPNTTSFENIGLIPGKKYSFRVAAFNTTGKSNYSNIATIEIALTLPVSPTMLSAELVESSVNLKWTDNSDIEDGFVLERSVNDYEFKLLGSLSSNEINFTDPNVEFGSSYNYRIYSFNDVGKSDYSNIASIALVSPPYPNPSDKEVCIHLPAVSNSGAEVSLVNSSGLTIQIVNQKFNASDNTLCIPIDTLEKGIYYLIVKLKNGKVIIHKFVKA